jgi:hypothetical protein
MKLPITITYNSGEQATFVAQPPEWAKWERETKKTIQQASEIGIWDLLFLAYQAHKRENAGKPVKPFEAWMESVADITAENDDPKDTRSEA